MCVILVSAILCISIASLIDDVPKTIVVKDVKGLVNCDFQVVVIENRFGRTIAKGKDVINKKTQPIVDNALSYKIADDKFYVETLYWGGVMEYDFKTKEFDYSQTTEKTEIEDPDGELVFEESSYYGGEQVELKL